MRSLRLPALAAGMTLLCVAAGAQTAPAVYASGLLSPSKVILGPSGTLVVTEAGAAANTGRISVIAPGGLRFTLVDGLPSAGADGPNGVAIVGKSLYIANGEGDAFVAGATAGSQMPNPAGMASPLFASVIRVTFDDAPERLLAGFTLKPADHYTLLDGNPVRLDNGLGQKATVELVTQFRFAVPDTKQVWRNSHPYGLTMLPDRPKFLYMPDAGMNTVVEINLETGRARTLSRFPFIPNTTGQGPPVIEAVPTSVTPYSGHLLVSYLSGAPFVAGYSGVMEVDLETGKATPFIAYLSSAIDVLFRLKQNGDGQFLALEYSAALTRGAPGRLKSWTGNDYRVLADNLAAPSSMVLQPETGVLYITSRSEGKVLAMELGR